MAVENAARVLVVEDERIIALDLAESLSAGGLVVVGIAGTADAALDCARDAAPDVALVDIRIRGDRDGVALAGELMGALSIPVVFLTAHDDPATRARALATTPYGYLVKPAAAGELRCAVDVAVRRHQLERRMRARDRWIETSLASIGDGVIAVDPVGRVGFINPRAAALAGVGLAEAVGQSAETLLGERMGADALVGALRRARLGREVVRGRGAAAVRPGAPPQLFDHTTAPVLDGDVVLGAVMVLRDVTAHRMLERRVALSERLATLGSLAAGVAHELNNPLSVVVGEAELLAEALAEDRAAAGLQSGVGSVLRAADQIARIVEDLRLYAAHEAPRAASAPLGRVVAWALRLARAELRGRGIRVEVDVPDGLRVGMDEQRLCQVLSNLLTNAAQALDGAQTPDGRVVVVATEDHRGFVQIDVRDNGPGMSAAVLAQALDPFFTTKAGAGSGGGLGLGLAISEGLVAECGGSLTVQSEVGIGTTVRLRLQPDEGPSLAAGGDGAAPLGGARLRVLVVDDDPAVGATLRRMLAGHRVEQAADGRAALDWLARAPFDLLIVDLVMPGMGGDALYEAIVELYPALASRVLLCTAGPTTVAGADFVARFPNPVLAKPVHLSALRAALRALGPALAVGGAGGAAGTGR